MEYPLYIGLATVGLSFLGIIALIIVVIVAIAMLGKVKVKSKDIVLGPREDFNIEELTSKLVAELSWRGVRLSQGPRTDESVGLTYSDFFEEIDLWIRIARGRLTVTYNVYLTQGFMALLAILVLLGWPWAALLAGVWYARFKGHVDSIENAVRIVAGK